MEASLLETIALRLKAIPNIQAISTHRMGNDEKPDGYPFILILKDTLDNSFADSGSNHRAIRFKIWAIVDATNVDNTKLDTEILPNLSDAILDALDLGWDFGTVGGHRIWAKFTASSRGFTNEEKGLVAWEEFDLLVRFDKNIT